MRLFVAAYPSQEALDDLETLVGRLSLARYGAGNDINVRLTARELWHVTLAFLGEVRDDRTSDAVDALESISCRPHELRIGGGGRFGRGRFTVLWAGLRGDVDLLAEAATQVRSALTKARLPYDRKPFRPHVTIARPGNRAPAAAVAADISALHTYDGPTWTCDGIGLVASHPGPKPWHEMRGQVRLG